MKEFRVSTEKRYELIDITDEVERMVGKIGKGEKKILVFTPHSTAAILITENEEGLKNDWLGFFEKLISGMEFQHNRIDNNADSHILSGLVGQGKALIAQDGRLERGVWQRIFLAEFDGPRKRRILVSTV